MPALADNEDAPLPTAAATGRTFRIGNHGNAPHRVARAE